MPAGNAATPACPAPPGPAPEPRPARSWPRSACSGWSGAPCAATAAWNRRRGRRGRVLRGTRARRCQGRHRHRADHRFGPASIPGCPEPAGRQKVCRRVCAELINAQADLRGRNGGRGSCAALPQTRRNRSGTGHRPITWLDRQTRRSGPAAMKALVTHARRRTGGESAGNRSSGLDRPEPAGSTRQSGQAAETGRLTCASRTSGWWQLAW